MQTLIGESITQLPPGACRLSAGDRFFTSQPAAPGSLYDQYLSRHVRYDALVERVFADLSSAFGFGSMSQRLSDEYAPADHSHPFNSFNLSVAYDLDGDDSGMVLASFRIDGRTIRLCAPALWTYEYPEPQIGELKFKALPVLPGQIDINADGFDGWTYPDGRTYAVAAEDFQEAKECFGQEIGATSLTVPCLSGFFKAAPGAVSAVSAKYANHGVPPHRHVSNVQLDGGRHDITVTARTTFRAGNGGSLHNGSTAFDPDNTTRCNLLFNVEDFGVDKCEIGSSDAGLDQEQYPPFGRLPAMIYIGKR